jgi:two-component system, NtrC family, response regulator HydG
MSARILFLDDEAPMCELLSGFFRGKGFEVATATSGKAAMDLADKESFDLAVFDINIAGENGLELLGYFKGSHPALPVIMLTGMTGNDELLEQARLRGASGFMCKTDKLDDLFAALKSYLPAR